MIVYAVIFEASRDWGHDCVCFSESDRADNFAKTVKWKVRKCFVEKEIKRV